SATAIKDEAGNFVMSRSTLFDIHDRKRAENERQLAQTALQQANEQLETKVQERTTELAQANTLLQVELRDRQRAEKALSESEKQLRLITDALPVLIAYVDSAQCYRFNNQAYEHWFGVSRMAIAGLPLQQVLGEAVYGSIKPHIEAVMAGQEASYETLVPYKNGDLRWVHVIYVPDFNQQGEVKGFVALITDITDRKRAQQVLQQAKEDLELKVKERTAELNQLNQDLVRSNQELEQFAYIASHDLQEPLRAITGYTQLLMQDYQDQLGQSAQEYTAYIVDGAKRMQQLIQDLLAYSRVGTRELAFTPTDCNEILNQVLKNLQVAIGEHNATILSDPLPTVIADNNQLMQLLQNLIGNGIKFHRQEPPQINISAELRDNEWLFQVRDNGIGIKPRYLDRIFEIFKRLHTRTNFPGTGIGLAICKKIVDRHGGRIWATSEPGVGTTFYFTIPQHHDHSNV
ncbi:MAG: ATP-binding protein, partial [Kovacikia sp.]